jgi:hypothetical protein
MAQLIANLKEMKIFGGLTFFFWGDDFDGL